MTKSAVITAAFLVSVFSSIAWGEDSSSRTVIYGDVATSIGPAPINPPDLWMTPADLTRATRLELKPEGVCTDKACIPLPPGRRSTFVVERGGETWFNLSEFARLLKQPAAHDAAHAVWYFGPRPEAQNRYLATLQAPDFRLPDLEGRMHALADFRGKKVLLITWASW